MNLIEIKKWCDNEKIIVIKTELIKSTQKTSWSKVILY